MNSQEDGGLPEVRDAVNLDLKVSARASKKATFKEGDSKEEENLNLIEETNSMSAYISNDS